MQLTFSERLGKYCWNHGSSLHSWMYPGNGVAGRGGGDGSRGGVISRMGRTRRSGMTTVGGGTGSGGGSFASTILCKRGMEEMF